MSVTPGFRSDHVLSGHVSLPWNSYHEPNAVLSFADRFLDGITAQPGVVDAALATNIPLSGNNQLSAVQVKGRVLQAGESNRGHYTYGVTGNYFSTLGIALQQGRSINRDDTRRPDRVCVVDADFARRYWPQGSPVGQSVFLGGGTHTDDEAFTIVGVVDPVRQADVTDSSSIGIVYFPLQFRLDLHLVTVVRSAQSPETLGATLQSVVRAIDPNLPLDDVRSMDTLIADSLVTRRTPALLATIFAAIALLLAAIGTYGVLAYAVSQRRREIGVRMALGALPRQVLNQFIRLGSKLLLTGIAVGLLGAWAAGRTMQSILFNVTALDVGVLAASAGTMAMVVLLAVILPSRRAAHVNPIEVLRAE
jgi:predicted permease